MQKLVRINRLKLLNKVDPLINSELPVEQLNDAGEVIRSMQIALDGTQNNSSMMVSQARQEVMWMPGPKLTSGQIDLGASSNIAINLNQDEQ